MTRCVMMTSLCPFLAAIALFSTSRNAYSQTNDNCNSGTDCLTANNSRSGGPGISATTTNSIAVYGSDNSGEGVWGSSTGQVGVYGQTTSGSGVYGDATGYGYGVQAKSVNSAGLYATSTNSYAISAQGANTVIYADGTGSGDTILAESSNGFSTVAGVQSGTGNGVYGSATSGDGVAGLATTGNAVYGSSQSGYGVYATSASNVAVWGSVDNNYAAILGVNTGNGEGVFGQSTNGYGVYGVSSNSWAGYFAGSVNVTNGIQVNNTCIAGTCSLSDRRLKKNIEPLHDAIDRLLQIKGVTFEWKNPEEHNNRAGSQTGVIAQDVEKVFPEWVSEDDKGIKAVNIDARAMAAVTVEAIRTLKAKSDAQEERIKELESGRRPLVSGIDLNGVGFGVGGLAIAAAILISRRRRPEQAQVA